MCVCVCVCVYGAGGCAYINAWRYVVVHVQMCTCVPSVVDGVGAVCAGACLHECVYCVSVRLLTKKKGK